MIYNARWRMEIIVLDSCDAAADMLRKLDRYDEVADRVAVLQQQVQAAVLHVNGTLDRVVPDKVYRQYDRRVKEITKILNSHKQNEIGIYPLTYLGAVLYVLTMTGEERSPETRIHWENLTETIQGICDHFDVNTDNKDPEFFLSWDLGEKMLEVLKR